MALLLQILIAGTVMLIIGAQITEMMKSSLLLEKDVRQVSDFQLLISQIAVNLNSPSACNAALGGQNYSTLNKLYMGPSSTLPYPGTPFGSLNVTKVSVTKGSPIAANPPLVPLNTYAAILTIQASKIPAGSNGSVATGGNILSQDIPMQMTLAGSNITGCFATTLLTAPNGQTSFAQQFCELVLTPHGKWDATTNQCDTLNLLKCSSPNQVLATDSTGNPVCMYISCPSPTANALSALPTPLVTDATGTSYSCFLTQVGP